MESYINYIKIILQQLSTAVILDNIKLNTNFGKRKSTNKNINILMAGL